MDAQSLAIDLASASRADSARDHWLASPNAYRRTAQASGRGERGTRVGRRDRTPTEVGPTVRADKVARHGGDARPGVGQQEHRHGAAALCCGVVRPRPAGARGVEGYGVHGPTDAETGRWEANASGRATSQF